MIALYHSIQLDKISQTVSLARSVSSSMQNRGRYIRHLRFCVIEHRNDSAEEIAAWVEASHTVLLSATQLVSFGNEPSVNYGLLLFSANVRSFGSHLTTIRAAPQYTLRSLDLMIGNNQARGVLLHLKEFNCLERLDIHLLDERASWSGLIDIDGVSPGTWDKVKHIQFKLSDKRKYDALEQYLLACRFPRVQTIVLFIPDVSPCFEEGVISFLDAHKATCETLSFTTKTALKEPTQFYQRLGSVLLNTADHLWIESVAAPGLDLFESWAPNVKIAQLTLDIAKDYNDQEQLWNVLQQASQKDFRPRGLQLDIVWRGRAYSGGPRDKAEFASTLLGIALELAPKGLSITNQSGKVLVPPVLSM
jgi:hypothetical protein